MYRWQRVIVPPLSLSLSLSFYFNYTCWNIRAPALVATFGGGETNCGTNVEHTGTFRFEMVVPNLSYLCHRRNFVSRRSVMKGPTHCVSRDRDYVLSFSSRREISGLEFQIGGTNSERVENSIDRTSCNFISPRCYFSRVRIHREELASSINWHEIHAHRLHAVRLKVVVILDF